MEAAEVFDTLGLEYQRAWSHQPALHGTLAWLVATLPSGSQVLDAGCGTGVPVARTLAKAGMKVTGVDVSPVMVELASSQVPGATFQRADVRDLTAVEGSYDLICSVFALLQMPQAEIVETLRRMASWLRPGGHLFLATVAVDAEQVTLPWMGQEIVVSSFSEETYVSHLEDLGFHVIRRSRPVFTPSYPGATPEESLYLVCRRGS
ncbi:class I SAM-dependent methyltransferase [Lentzea tibetensis]|uniref:Class I SAM-dependent methyltransferase n=1 Tax=Lentzea tibetensis TaxID=2591470 RepID=A0A563ERQ9_9PSEU|nr:class I SAM-dependent methyltransferase [Lentzea tibetensis]TWP50211.1 class I SAM-dependent methyltransferase [Lentzea tibetensis]